MRKDKLTMAGFAGFNENGEAEYDIRQEVAQKLRACSDGQNSPSALKEIYFRIETLFNTLGTLADNVQACTDAFLGPEPAKGTLAIDTNEVAMERGYNNGGAIGEIGMALNGIDRQILRLQVEISRLRKL